MKKYLIILFFTICSFNVFGQKKVDVIYLNNGSIIKGNIVENNANSIKIETFCDNILAYTPEEISEISVENYIDKRAIKTKGYINFTSFGALVGSTSNDLRAPFSFLMEHSYRIIPNLAVGAVIGVEMLNEATIPVGGNIKFMYPIDGGSTFFIAGTYAYSVSAEDATDPVYEITNSYGGKLANAELGLIFPSYGHLSFFVAAGYRYNELSYTRSDWYLQEVDRKIYYNRISLRVGVAFY
jgi:hypothetical protein